MKSKSIVFASILLFIAGSSCTKTTLETKYNNQEDSIDKYISAQRLVKRTDVVPEKIDTVLLADSIFDYILEGDEIVDSIFVRIDTTFRMDTTFRDTTWTDTLRVVNKGSSNRMVRKEGTGEELKANGNIAFYYAGYTFNTNKGSLFMTNHEATSIQDKWSITDQDFSICEMNLGKTELIEGLKSGLTGVKAGEECEILFSGKYGFGDNEFGIIPANSALLYYIWVIAVSND